MYINIYLSSLNIFEENQFYEIKKRNISTIYSIMHSVIEQYEQNEQYEWTVEMKRIFLGDWMCKCVSYDNY